MNSLNTVCLLMYFYAIDLCASMCAHLSVIVKYTSLWKHSVDSLLLFLCMHAPLPPTPPPTPPKKEEEKRRAVVCSAGTWHKGVNIYLTAINVNYEKSLAKDIVESKQFFFMCFS